MNVSIHFNDVRKPTNKEDFTFSLMCAPRAFLSIWHLQSMEVALVNSGKMKSSCVMQQIWTHMSWCTRYIMLIRVTCRLRRQFFDISIDRIMCCNYYGGLWLNYAIRVRIYASQSFVCFYSSSPSLVSRDAKKRRQDCQIAFSLCASCRLTMNSISENMIKTN